MADPWPAISESAKDLIRKMVVRNPEKRYTAHEVLCKDKMVSCDLVLGTLPEISLLLYKILKEIHYGVWDMLVKFQNFRVIFCFVSLIFSTV